MNTGGRIPHRIEVERSNGYPFAYGRITIDGVDVSDIVTSAKVGKDGRLRLTILADDATITTPEYLSRKHVERGRA